MKLLHNTSSKNSANDHLTISQELSLNKIGLNNFSISEKDTYCEYIMHTKYVSYIWQTAAIDILKEKMR